MFVKNLSLIILFDRNGRILLQDRKSMSKHGEEWGYFGGKIDAGESPEEAIVREIKEELEFNLKDFKFLKEYVAYAKLLRNGEMAEVKHHVFLKLINLDDFDKMVLHEGDGMKWFSIEEAKKLNMLGLDPKVLEDFEIYFKKEGEEK
jgi:mutator protein MutT